MRKRLLCTEAWSVIALLALVITVPASAQACPNDAIRQQQGSTFLPDCRAYELVTPSDSSGRSVQGISSFRFTASGGLFPTELITPSGDGVAFATFDGPLGDLGGLTGTIDVTGVQRFASGWKVTRRFSPGGGQAVFPIPGGISEDHLFAFAHVEPVNGNLPGGSLAAGGEAEYLSNPDGSFELVGIGSIGGTTVTERFAQGRYISAGGEHVIFSTGRLESGSYSCNSAALKCPVQRLALNAPPEGTGVIYDRSADGPTKVVSLLPEDKIPDSGEDAAYQGASKDGATVAFEIAGTLYVRVPDDEDGETFKVAEGAPLYAGLSQEGRYLFYLVGGEKGTIHRFDTLTQDDLEVNPGAEGEVVNISPDSSHVYFISEPAIGGEGTPGAPNLYVWSGGNPRYVATVATSDLEKTSNDGIYEKDFTNGYPSLTNWTDWAVTPERNKGKEQGPGADSSRTTPDGSVLVFESKAKLTSYENAGNTEIYRYDDNAPSLAQKLICVSCNFSASSANAGARLQLLTLLPPPNVIHNLSDDGSRVFFETPEALAPEDVDGVNDVYEWQAEGTAGGWSRGLISSGRSSAEIAPLIPEPLHEPKPNVIFAISPSGGDVVFLSQDDLVAGAGVDGTSALYDARAGGGFLEPDPPNTCSEEECRAGSAVSLPPLSGGRSEDLRGPGNVKRRKRHHCRRRSKGRAHHHRCSKRRTKRAETSGAVAASGGATSSDAPEQPVQPQDPVSGPVSLKSSAVSGPSTKLSGEGDFDEFGIKAVDAGENTAVAGAHPDFTTRLELNHFIAGNGLPAEVARTEDISVRLPPGLVGDTNVPKCGNSEFLAFANCPLGSQVGVVKVLVFGLSGEFTEPLYALAPSHPEEEVVRFGFIAGTFPVFIDVKVRTAEDYGVVASVHHGPGQASLISATTTLWGDPTAPSHDKERLIASEAFLCPGTACLTTTGEREVPRTDIAFMANPSRCQENSVGFSVTSYQLPGQLFTATAPMEPTTDCAGLAFAPTFETDPTSHAAGSPTGLKTKLVLPQHLHADERSTATIREARVTLPAGMQIAAGAANWIGTCSDQQVGFHEEIDTNCPDASKLGTATITSPALSDPIQGTLYQRSPQSGHQFGLWLTSDALGLHVKLPGELEPDKNTGRLTAVFKDLPQVPVEEINLNIWGGARAPLQNPDHCGTFTTDFSFSPNSNDPTATGQSAMQITEECGQGFSPTLKAAVTEPMAGKFSPFVFDLRREDGQQGLRGFELKLPDGELAKLKGVPLCSDADAAAGACPEASRIGSLNAITGPGPEPLVVPQPGKSQPQIYLAGPYQGAPFSIVSEVPAQAGPFDLGVLAVRSGLDVEPETGQALIKADPLPQFFEGVGIAYRDLRAVIDRPNFSLNSTDCREMAVTSTVTSTQGIAAHPRARFQLDGCKALKFKPRLSLKLSGGSKRAQYPGLTAILRPRRGDANIAFASVAMPHSEFLAQEHIGTICTRKQFVADGCPKGSIYGEAKAWTPLLDKPLAGPVYLRSSNHLLPDLVAKLDGQLEIDLVGRIDSKHGGIRTTFESVPDAPVSKFVLRMKGGAKGLLTNSTDICHSSHRATVVMHAQNGRARSVHSVLKSQCGGAGSKSHRSKRH